MSFATIKSKISALTEPVRIGIGLGLGFGVTFALVILIMVVGYSYMAKIYSNLEQLTQNSNIKVDLAHTMIYVQRDRALHLYAMALISDAFEKDEQLQLFDRRGAEFLSAWKKFQSLPMNPQELDLSSRLNKMMQERNILVTEAIELLLSGHGQTQAEYIRKIIIPGQQDVTNEINKLLQLQQEQAQKAVASALNAYQNARRLLLWLSSVTVLIIIMVAVFVLRQVMRQSRELEQKALFDDLTGLPNRALFFDRLAQAALAFANENKPFSIAVVNLDRFKEVNDAEGHHIGDLLLKHVAKTISVSMRRTDTVARMGGDEFVLLLPSVLPESSESVIQKLLPLLNQRVNLEGIWVNIASSIGIAFCPEHDVDVEQLLLKADMAMYAAKRANVGFRLYSAEIEARAVKNVALQNELRLAIDNKQLVLHYQPKINHQSGCVIGVEALVRWMHPEKGMISPDDFIPLAEASGLIQPLASWVLEAAFQQSVKWHDAGYAISIAVNLSTRNLLDGDLPARVAKLLATYKVKPEWLMFEITESAVMAEPARALETLIKINRMGIQLSLDDFGTGYSSLAYLKKLPVSEIKIDKSFIKDMELDSSDTVIVRSTIALGQNLGMKVVAEGVENAQIWKLLTELGCDASQGYYMSRPLSAEALDEWLKTSPWAQEKMNTSNAYSGAERRNNERVQE
ncbi:MAG: EAL domain-containing protein [Gallionellaceae bacterium]|jgi:diguanylate cyclase (GGDEF)-like protein